METFDGPDVVAVLRAQQDSPAWLHIAIAAHPKSENKAGIHGAYIVIRLQDIPKTSAGVVFGADKCCDVSLPLPDTEEKQGLHPAHFSVGFDHDQRLVVNSFDPGKETAVTYNHQWGEEQPKRDGSWIVSRDDISQAYWTGPSAELAKLCKISINLGNGLRFDLLPGQASQRRQPPNMRIQWFRQGTESDDALYELMPPASCPRSLSEKCLIRRRIGAGGFGVAYHRWNPSTGHEDVEKKPQDEYSSRPIEDVKKAWMREARFMNIARHENIVKFKYALVDPSPSIVLEYMPGGSLHSNKSNITPTAAMVVLQQCLAALDFLHSHRPPIVHRDITPSNILLDRQPVSGEEENMVVKLADFGLAKEVKSRVSIKGTRPDIASIGPELDVWALGLVVFELLSGRYCDYSETPAQREMRTEGACPFGLKMHDDIAKSVREFTRGDKNFMVLEDMLVVNPAGRLRARDAYAQAQKMKTSAFVRKTAIPGHVPPVNRSPEPPQGLPTPRDAVSGNQPPPLLAMASEGHPSYDLPDRSGDKKGARARSATLSQAALELESEPEPEPELEPEPNPNPKKRARRG